MLTRLALSLPLLYMAERHDRRLLNMKLFEAYKGVLGAIACGNSAASIANAC